MDRLLSLQDTEANPADDSISTLYQSINDDSLSTIFDEDLQDQPNQNTAIWISGTEHVAAPVAPVERNTLPDHSNQNTANAIAGPEPMTEHSIASNSDAPFTLTHLVVNSIPIPTTRPAIPTSMGRENFNPGIVRLPANATVDNLIRNLSRRTALSAVQVQVGQQRENGAPKVHQGMS